MFNIILDGEPEETKLWLCNAVDYLIKYAEEHNDEDLLPEVATVNSIINAIDRLK